MENENKNSEAKIMRTVKYTFPSLRRDNKFYTLDGKRLLQHSTYHVYTKEGNNNMLSQDELDYNYRLNEVTEQHKHELEHMRIKFEACSNILERLRGSVWAYIAFRFKL